MNDAIGKIEGYFYQYLESIGKPDWGKTPLHPPPKPCRLR